MKLAVSLAALAVVLMTSSALAKDPKTDSSTTNAKPTAANAAAFIARAEKELFDYSVDASRVAWVNATYITDDTDALAAQSGAKGTEMAVRFALEAATYKKVHGLHADMKRKLTVIRGALVLPAPTTAGAAAEIKEIAPKIHDRKRAG